MRVYDIRDARQPKEFAYFVPADPTVRIGTKPSRLVAQSEDVLVDRRGFIYLSDKNHGIHILQIETNAGRIETVDGNHLDWFERLSLLTFQSQNLTYHVRF